MNIVWKRILTGVGIAVSSALVTPASAKHAAIIMEKSVARRKRACGIMIGRLRALPGILMMVSRARSIVALEPCNGCTA